MENSAHGLTLLDPDHRVVVTGEEHYQHVLSAYAPRADGQARRVAVELGFTPGSQAQTAVEIRLDGQRVGELTQLMTRRYGPLVDGLLRRGQRPGAVALIVRGRRGWIEMELRLPEVQADSTAPLPIPPIPRPPHRPNPGPGSGPDGRRPPRARRSRTPYLVGGGVLALLIAVGAAVGGPGGTPTTSAAAPPTVRAVAPTTAPITSVPPTVVVEPAPVEPADVDRNEQIPPAGVTRAPEVWVEEAPVPQPARQPVPQPEARPAPEPAPAPAPAPAPEPAPVTPAIVSYQNCDAVRAAGADPIRAGDPGYSRKLDRDGDGVGCE